MVNAALLRATNTQTPSARLCAR